MRLLNLFLLATGVSAVAAHQEENNRCERWCITTFGHLSAGCIALAARGKGPCYECGPAARQPSSKILCNKNCVAVGNQNCGGCGITCGRGKTCQGGRCCGTGKTCQGGKCICPAGSINCSGTCKNIWKDNANCGACGKGCDNGKTCERGRCVCSAGSTNCSGNCKNLKSDNSNCGACGKAVCTLYVFVLLGKHARVANVSVHLARFFALDLARTCRMIMPTVALVELLVPVDRRVRPGNAYVLLGLLFAPELARTPKAIFTTAALVVYLAVVAMYARPENANVLHPVVSVTWATLVLAAAKPARISTPQRPLSVIRKRNIRIEQINPL
ncbi:PE-PGRS family protein [Microsporum canis CBS 113480]|uniref:PE-PGRS family protein n=1 Tax=Arthroderma otae (strain ATCC MYA-4605 / CBS 113480) TaxID=554155 RepID=C5FJM5_ARTOC|nr:PE-PGRS family protein [Microsporum canis CBS 113480]EEQ30886.1 PE-PGRS family protein [Microsporum canis CBS 113480]